MTLDARAVPGGIRIRRTASHRSTACLFRPCSPLDVIMETPDANPKAGTGRSGASSDSATPEGSAADEQLESRRDTNSDNSGVSSDRVTETGDTRQSASEHARSGSSFSPSGETSDETSDGRKQTPAVAIDGITKQFGSGEKSVTAVDDVSFDIKQGSVVGLLGHNGAGKTTLIKCVLGTVLPDEGTIRVQGIDVRADPRAAFAHVDAMLEGARNDYWRLTVRENLRYFATISGVNPDAVEGRHQRLLEQLELADEADTAVRDLSRGMKQKVSLASALAGGADVVFLDEPTLGLDVEASRVLQTELRRLAEERNITIVLSSHDMDVVETVCDRVLIMSEGQVVADGTVNQLLEMGGPSGVRVASSDLSSGTVADLRDRFDVTAVERRARGASLEMAVQGDEIYELFANLRDAGVGLEQVDTVEPDFEDILVEQMNIRRGSGQ